ncbi:MAG: chromosome segregation protein SMC [Xenococcaceae cyanobacterium MO_207.B15]|nr:chromosome segregation protein SMC [Xenococcaceae cyanobacterium MO_207.B15]MDJ0743894.1 chromosome segregation protein SMC [Xenococcaceae cyanobacterium MO_167.B27]
MEDINKYLTSIQQDIVGEDKTIKVARLIILLIKIEKELDAVRTTLAKLKSHQQKYKRDSPIGEHISKKLATVDNLLAKIRKARLNLNFYFI